MADAPFDVNATGPHFHKSVTRTSSRLLLTFRISLRNTSPESSPGLVMAPEVTWSGTRIGRPSLKLSRILIIDGAPSTDSAFNSYLIEGLCGEKDFERGPPPLVLLPNMCVLFNMLITAPPRSTAPNSTSFMVVSTFVGPGGFVRSRTDSFFVKPTIRLEGVWSS